VLVGLGSGRLRSGTGYGQRCFSFGPGGGSGLMNAAPNAGMEGRTGHTVGGCTSSDCQENSRGLRFLPWLGMHVQNYHRPIPVELPNRNGQVAYLRSMRMRK